MMDNREIITQVKKAISLTRLLNSTNIAKKEKWVILDQIEEVRNGLKVSNKGLMTLMKQVDQWCKQDIRAGGKDEIEDEKSEDVPDSRDNSLLLAGKKAFCLNKKCRYCFYTAENLITYPTCPRCGSKSLVTV